MKIINLSSAAFIMITFSLSFCVSAQNDVFNFPEIQLNDVSGQSINTKDFQENSNPLIIIFWKSCCKSHVNLFDAISENIVDWEEETNVKIYAVSTDDTRSSAKVAPYVNARAWELNFILDPNSDFKRAMGVNMMPHIFIFDKQKKIVFQKTYFMNGDEDEIYKTIKGL